MFAVVAAHPANHADRWALLNFLVDTRQISKAAAQADALSRLGIHDPREALALVNACLALKQYSQAEALCRKLIQNGQGQAEAWQALATAYFLQRHYFEAMQAGRQAVKLAPSSPGAHLALASAALQYGLQFGNSETHHEALDLAHTEFQNLIKAFPNNPTVCLRLGQADIARSQWQEAVAPLTQAVALEPTAEGYYNLAYAEKNASDPVAARRTLTDALAQFPNDAALHDLNGQILQTAPAPSAASQALAEFQTAVRLDPTSADDLQHEGSGLLQMGQLPEAQAAFIAALRIDPNRAFPFQQLAVIYTREGKPAQASQASKDAAAMVFNRQQLSQVQAMLALHPDSVPLHLILADRYRQLGMLGAARDEYLLVSQLDPGNARARRGLADLKASAPQ